MGNTNNYIHIPEFQIHERDLSLHFIEYDYMNRPKRTINPSFVPQSITLSESYPVDGYTRDYCINYLLDFIMTNNISGSVKEEKTDYGYIIYVPQRLKWR